ncbi:Elongin-B [Apodemus speciosus]|uniref:Elongin-B n=1 Tax=Apodemus speciosus TaxID=105296 RepID=A0ABQ0FN35_APOSI
MIRRHKTTIFTDAKESSTVFELKRIVEGILKRPPEEQRLYKDDQLLDDGKTLGECGFTSQTARPQAPATVGLAFRAATSKLGQRSVMDDKQTIMHLLGWSQIPCQALFSKSFLTQRSTCLCLQLPGAEIKDEAFEALRIEPFSSPPELPDVMKPQDSGGSANEQAVQ